MRWNGGSLQDLNCNIFPSPGTRIRTHLPGAGYGFHRFRAGSSTTRHRRGCDRYAGNRRGETAGRARPILPNHCFAQGRQIPWLIFGPPARSTSLHQAHIADGNFFMVPNWTSHTRPRSSNLRQTSAQRPDPDRAMRATKQPPRERRALRPNRRRRSRQSAWSCRPACNRSGSRTSSNTRCSS